MNERTCATCVYAIQPTKAQRFNTLMARWRCPLSCLNHADSPGVQCETWPTNTCRNYRAKGKRQRRAPLPEPLTDAIRYIPLTQGKYAIVDAGDYERLSQYRWYATRTRSGACYAATNMDGTTVFMHRLIMNAPKGKVVDHINGNGLDDRAANLRICTPGENA